MDVFLLEMRMKQRNKTNESVAAYLGIDPATFYRKKKGDSDFSRKEIQKMRSFLDLTAEDVDQIFFSD